MGANAVDLFATPKPIDSTYGETPTLPYMADIRAITAKLCTSSRLAIREDYSPCLQGCVNGVPAS